MSRKNTNDQFSNLPLWDHFINISKEEDIALIRNHINFAMPLLDFYIKAFPTYTLHNGQHQTNIIKLVGELLGPKLKELTSLECAILILSAIYHDLGMVFTDEEISSIESEPAFKVFLERNLKAKLDYEQNSRKATRELIEWYCRSVHAERVWIFLDKAEKKFPFLWNTIPFKKQLGNVCESHNLSVKDIKNRDTDFNNSFLGECDLTFCAILLRLADIFDFDNTRSPKSVYEYLGLNEPKNHIESISKIEWQKHLSSQGFKFKRKKNIVTVLFKAAPNHPRVEIEIRNFLDLIELELKNCRELQKICSKKWSKIEFPSIINRDNIISTNYRSGKYHFSLSQEKVLDLLTGEQLYNDEYIFLRELLQNSIDTCRHREFRERHQNSAFCADGIEISYFTDHEGYKWIRIDDFGMGMTEDIINNHLLKKGESYYNSDRFKLEKLLINQTFDIDFVPISRFGIGLLSCFITSDKIEISTKHIDELDNAYRLTLEGRNGFFIFQSSKDHDIPNPMPAENGFDSNYRQKAGTSIAVRITGNKEYHGFDFKKKIESYVLCSPVRINYNGQLIGGEWKSLLEEPWTTNQIIDIDTTFLEDIEKTFKVNIPKPLQIEVSMINLSEESLNSNIKGQLVFIRLLTNSSFSKISLPKFNLTSSRTDIILKATNKILKNGKSEDLTIEHRIGDILPKLDIPKKITDRYYFNDDPEFRFHGFQLSHNGIVINDREGFFSLNNVFGDEVFLTSSFDTSFIYCGLLYFQDQLLPSLTVSRNEIKDISFELMFNVTYCLNKLNGFLKYENDNFNFFDRKNPVISTRNIIKNSEIYEKNKTLWDNKSLFLVEGRYFNVIQIKEYINTNPFILNNPHFYINRMFNNFALYILEENFEVEIQVEKLEYGFQTCYKLSNKNYDIPQQLSNFKPFTFFKFEQQRSELIISDKINVEHKFIKWYLKAANYLNSEFNFYSNQLIYGLYDQNIDKGILNINSILDRLRKSLPNDIKPDKSINLNNNDFYTINYPNF